MRSKIGFIILVVSPKNMHNERKDYAAINFTFAPLPVVSGTDRGLMIVLKPSHMNAKEQWTYTHTPPLLLRSFTHTQLKREEIMFMIQ